MCVTALIPAKKEKHFPFSDRIWLKVLFFNIFIYFDWKFKILIFHLKIQNDEHFRLKIQNFFSIFFKKFQNFSILRKKLLNNSNFFTYFVKISLTHIPSVSISIPHFQVDYEKSLKIYHNTPAYLAYMAAKSKKTGRFLIYVHTACFVVYTE